MKPEVHPHFLREKSKIEKQLPGCQTESCEKHATVMDGDKLYCAGCAHKSLRIQKKYFVKGGQDDETK